MIAGPPGSMKTAFTLNIVKNIQVPTFYNSSDSDDFTMASRSLASLSGMTTDQAEEKVMSQDEEAYKTLKSMTHVRWSFKSSPTIEHIIMENEAYCEIYGEYPHFTVVDIMMDIDCDGVAEQNYWTVSALLKDLARDQQTCVLMVHHTSESAKAGSPPPRSAIMGKANQLPAVILTLWGDSRAGTLDVAVVKNRFGPQDAMASHWFTMKADPSVMLIEEMPKESMLFRDGPAVPPNQKINLLED